MNRTEEPSSMRPRMSWIFSREVRIANRGEPGSIAGAMISANTTKRIQAISTDGSVFDRYFAAVSEVERKIVDSRIKAMPRNGRSERAGARLRGGGGAGLVPETGIGALMRR